MIVKIYDNNETMKSKALEEYSNKQMRSSNATMHKRDSMKIIAQIMIPVEFHDNRTTK